MSIYAYFKYSVFSESLFLIVFLSIIFLLSLFLLIDYIINGTKGRFEFWDNRIEVTSEGVRKIVKEAEIEKVVIYGSSAVYSKSGIFFLPFTCFHYAEIRTGKETFFLTSLSNYKLYENLVREPVLRKKVYLKKGGLAKRGELFNSIWLNTLH